jgi:hypothetical protein
MHIIHEINIFLILLKLKIILFKIPLLPHSPSLPIPQSPNQFLLPYSTIPYENNTANSKYEKKPD